MAGTPPETVTRLLQRWSSGDERVLDQLMPLVYDELREIAGRLMRGEREGHTLQTTALVHEAYARLVDAELSVEDRAHFFRLAATQMRRILVDHARAHGADKRGGGVPKLSLDEALVVGGEPSSLMIDLDRALDRLSRQDARKGYIVELSVFAGLKHAEIAELLSVSTSTVRQDLRFAKAWLHKEMSSA